MTNNNREDLPGMHPSPNIQEAPDIYEIENIAADPDGLLEKAMYTLALWNDKVVLDLGAGTGFHLPRFHSLARHVIAVEPHSPSRLRAMARVAKLGLGRVSVMHGSAERLLLPDASIDIVHARFAYFFPPHCEPGLIELARIIRPGGTAFIIDNDWEHGTFASWLKRHPWHRAVDSKKVEYFWHMHGFTLQRIASEWSFNRRADLEAVIRTEFPDQLAEQIISEHQGTRIEYHYCLYYRHY